MTPNAAGKVPVADPLAGPLPYAQGAIDAASFMGPGEAAKVGSLAALHLMPQIPKWLGKTGEHRALYDVANDAGKKVMELNTAYSPNARQLTVHWAGAPGAAEAATDVPWTSFAHQAGGTSEVRSLVKALMKEYPEMETITGNRASGARFGPAKRSDAEAETVMRVRKPKESE